MDPHTTVEMVIASNPSSLPLVREVVERVAGGAGFCDEDAHGLMLAIDEALANVIQHGYRGRTDQPIALRFSPVTAEDGRFGIEVTVRDRGDQVDPGVISGRPLDDVRPGGLGVHIIKTVMDECDYTCPPDGGMLLRMVKYIKDPGHAASAAAGPSAKGDAPGSEAS